MSYKRVIEKKGKNYGPYIYESYRDENGKVKKRYLGKVQKKRINYTFLFFAVGILFFLSIFVIGYSTNFFGDSAKEIAGYVGGLTGRSVSDDSSSESSGEFSVSSSSDSSDSASSDSSTASSESEPASSSVSTSEEPSEPSSSSEGSTESEEPSTAGSDSEQAVSDPVEESPVESEVATDDGSDSEGTVSGNETEEEPSNGEEALDNETVLEEPSNETVVNETSELDYIDNSSTSLNESEIDSNFSLNETATDFNFSLNDSGELVLANVTYENETGLNISTYKSRIVINQPVRWLKTLTVSKDEAKEVKVDVPKGAENISVRTEDEADKAKEEIGEKNLVGITGQATKISSNEGLLSRLINWIKSWTFTGRVIDEEELGDGVKELDDKKEVYLTDVVESSSENEVEIAVEYYTEAPSAFEENLLNGKRVTISAPDELNYTDVVSYSVLEDDFTAGMIRLYHLEGDEKVLSAFEAFDLDGDGLINMIEWVVPHLSNQTYEIILITNAQHLDENRDFIEDVYSYVRARDNSYVLIPDGDFIRVTFEQNLTSDRDITIYARKKSVTINGVEVPYEIYEKKKLLDELEGRI